MTSIHLPPPPYHWQRHTPGPGTIDGWQAFQTITAREDCEHLSLEELRLADYKSGSLDSKKQDFTFFATKEDRDRSNFLDLIQGPGIEICVGEDPCTQQTWSLPQNLLSYHSEFFKTACTISLRERHEKLIRFPEDSPDIFRLFMEWLYFGEYTLPLMNKERDNMDRQAWVLGDKLLCREFKEYAMTRLYGSYTNFLSAKRISPGDVEYACENSPVGAGLQRLIFDILGTYMPRMDSARLTGTEEEWSAVLDKYEENSGMARTYLMSLNKPNELQRSVEYYFDQEEMSDEQIALAEMPFWGRLDV